MSREEIDTLIVSDVHFGSELCNAALLFEVMSKFSCSRKALRSAATTCPHWHTRSIACSTTGRALRR